MFYFITHFYISIDYNSNFIFLEWNLPIIFGLLIIFENLYLLSSYIFIYLNGSNGRKIFIFSLVEDVINFFILVSRIILQILRGFICSLYHDFFKETLFSYISEMKIIIYIGNFISKFVNEQFVSIFFFVSIKMYLFIVSITFISLLVFLQLLFLFLAIWLFCKCWFVSIQNLYKFPFTLLPLIKKITILQK